MTNHFASGLTLASGSAKSGIVTTRKTVPCLTLNSILVAKSLTPSEYPLIRAAAAIIREDGSPSDHVSVICRILGIPVIQIPMALSIFKDGDTVTVVARESRVYKGNILLADTIAVCPDLTADLVRHASQRLQVSIVAEPDIKRANEKSAVCGVNAPGYFFLRAELLWLSRGILDPFKYLQHFGLLATIDFIATAMRACLKEMRSDQILNFRSLDMRSDEFGIVEDPPERNPDLGLHGIRQLLRTPGLLKAELLAIQRVCSECPGQVLFSLPFIIEREEFDAVVRIAHDIGIQDLPFSVFIETPAAVYEVPALLKRGVHTVFIGTKDLTQTILCCDRSNARVASLADPKKRPVVDAIRRTVSACVRNKARVFLFSMLDDAPFFLDKVSSVTGLSFCCGEYEEVLSTLRPNPTPHRPPSCAFQADLEAA